MEALHLSREPGKKKNCTLPKSLSFRGRYRDKYTHSQQPSAIRSISTWLLWRDTVFSLMLKSYLHIGGQQSVEEEDSFAFFHSM